MSAGPEEDYEHYNRALRCAYDDNEKLVWNSFGTCNRYELDPTKTNWQRETGTVESPPFWATGRFDSHITEFKEKALVSRDSVSVNSSTEDRLKELRYL